MPYGLWLVIVAALNLGYQIMHSSPITKDYLLALIKGGHYLMSPFSAFWFFTALFFVRLYARCLAVIRPWAVWIGAAVGLGLSVTVPRQLGDVWWAAGIAVPMLVFLAVGILVGRIDGMARLSSLVKAIVGVACLALGIVSYMVWPTPMDLKYANFGTPMVSMVGSGLICAGLVLLFSLFTFQSTLVSAIAQAGVPVLFIHPILLVWTGNYIHSHIIRFVVVLVVSFGIGLLINRFPKAKALLG